MPLFFQVGNIRSRIDPPDASCWPASDCGPEANTLRLMKDRQTGLMKNFPEQSGKVIRDRAEQPRSYSSASGPEARRSQNTGNVGAKIRTPASRARATQG